MTDFIDLERRFHLLTDAELEDTELLLAWSDCEFLPDTGWSDLLESSRVVLLAEAGAGKTVEMREQARRLTKENKFAFFMAVESLDRESVNALLSSVEESGFEAWKADGEALAWFFLDAVDELKLTRGKLDRALQRLSRSINGHLDRARIVISCRPSDWRPSRDLPTVQHILPISKRDSAAPSRPPEEMFTAVLGPDREETSSVTHEEEGISDRNATRTVVLLPMSDKQIKRFAEQSDMADTAAFLKDVARQNAWIFARRPLDLADLIATWTESGHLGTRAWQHKTNVIAKLRDDPERPDRDVLTDADARLGAEILALAISLTRTRTIRSPEQALDIRRADGVLEPAQILSSWTEEKRQALLRRALFDPATYGRVRFHHRSIQEYLAARRLRALREKGMSTEALFRLLFSERHGVRVVFPSMREIAAWLALWNDDVRRELVAREPETLLSLGDPESLDMTARGELLRAFVSAYGEGGRRGLNIPIAEVRRLAHPDLAPVIRECWGNGPKNDDVRGLLIKMVWQGRIKSCADLVYPVAFDTASRTYHRIMAIQALIACDSEEVVRVLANDMLDESTRWPDRIIHGVAEYLFPGIITVDELIALMKRTCESKQIVGGFEWVSQRIVETVEPRSKLAVDLRNKLADLIWNGRDEARNFYDISSQFNYLVPALTMLCERQLTESSDKPHADLIRACVIAFRFSDNSKRNVRDGPIVKLKERFQKDVDIRGDAFWAELDVMNEPVPTDDDWFRLYRVAQCGLTGDLRDSDQPWLEVALADKSRRDRRVVALHALIDGWCRRGRIVSELDTVRSKLRDDMTLSRILNAHTAPPKRDDTFEKIERENQQFQSAQADREARCLQERKRRLQEWKEWRDGLLADPVAAFSTERSERTISCLYSWLRAFKNDLSCYDVWNKDALTQVFGPDIADHAEKAFRSFWRTTQPVPWSARPAEAKSCMPYEWILGLMGVSAQASTQGWPVSLSPGEARTAAAHATSELSGFAPLIVDLTESHPAEVSEVIGGEVSAELGVGGDHEYLPALQNLTHAESNLKQLLVPCLLAELKSWPNPVTDETAPRWAHHLDQVLCVLDEANSEADREAIARECVARYGADPAGALALVWLRGLFRFDAVRGTHALIESLADGDDPGIRERAIETFAALFGARDAIVFEISDPARRADVLEKFVRCAYTFVRHEDDQVHEGMYSPNTRDHAETARGFLLSKLLNTPGPKARRAVLGLACEDDFAHVADWLRLLARQRTAADAEFAPFDIESVISLENNLEAPPRDRDGLFTVMRDRLDDLAHDLAHHDFSDRRTVRSITEESEMQRTLARRIDAMANGAYRVTREEEVADRKRTDIRLLAVNGHQAAVVEVKIADNWSLTDLDLALRDQLVRKYLRHSNCKAGCLLLTYRGKKKYWKHPTSTKRFEFSEICEFLKDKAQALEKENQDSVRIRVFALDLTDPQIQSID